mgnify:FL=1
MKRGGLALCAALLVCAGCADKAADETAHDPAKLSADLEERAQEIEAKADEAVAEAEAQADADLQALDEERAAQSDPVEEQPVEEEEK